MALLLIDLVESFAIAILDPLIDCEFSLTHCSLPHTRGIWVSLAYTTAIRHLKPPRKLVLTGQVHHAIRSYQLPNDVMLLEMWSTLTLAIWRTSLCSAYYFTIIPLSACT